MKRFHLLLLVFAVLVFTAVGCTKRTSEKPRLPVEIIEATDFITPRPIDDTSDAFAKRARKDPPPGDETPDQKRDRIALEEKTEKAAAQKEWDKREKILESVAKVYKSYFDTRTAKKLTDDDFKLRLTRAGLPKIRKALENQQFELIQTANPLFPEHIVAYWKEADNGVFQAAFINQTVGTVKEAVRPMQLLKQVVQCVYAGYIEYAPQAQQKSLDQFQAYLKENAQPAVLKAVVNQEIKVNFAAQVRNGGSLVACFARADPALGANTSLLAVMGDGTTKRFEQNEVAAIFQGR